MQQMIELIMLIGVVYWIGTTFGDAAGTIAISLLAVLLIGLIVSGCRKGDKAYGNMVRYWANGGPEQYRRKQSHR